MLEIGKTPKQKLLFIWGNWVCCWSIGNPASPARTTYQTASRVVKLGKNWQEKGNWIPADSRCKDLLNLIIWYCSVLRLIQTLLIPNSFLFRHLDMVQFSPLVGHKLFQNCLPKSNSCLLYVQVKATSKCPLQLNFDELCLSYLKDKAHRGVLSMLNPNFTLSSWYDEPV